MDAATAWIRQGAYNAFRSAARRKLLALHRSGGIERADPELVIAECLLAGSREYERYWRNTGLAVRRLE